MTNQDNVFIVRRYLGIPDSITTYAVYNYGGKILGTVHQTVNKEWHYRKTLSDSFVSGFATRKWAIHHMINT